MISYLSYSFKGTFKSGIFSKISKLLSYFCGAREVKRRALGMPGKHLQLVLILSLCDFGPGSHDVAQTGLKILILLHEPPRMLALQMSLTDLFTFIFKVPQEVYHYL